MAKRDSESAKKYEAARAQARRVRQHWSTYGTIPKLRVLHNTTAAFIRQLGLNPQDYLIGSQDELKYKRGLSKEAKEGRRRERKREYYHREAKRGERL